ncbi:MAG TPA: hypothetical protein GXX14_02160, partial [Clostridiaceae bacterium]|nr:hypothetical protein [Clostridiaceae bacterium]
MKILRKVNIRTRIMLSLLFGIIFFSSLILFIFKSFSQSFIERYLYDYLRETQQEVAKSMELLIDEVNMLSARLLTNRKIYNVLTDEDSAFDVRQAMLRDIFDEMVVNTRVVGDIVFYVDSNTVFRYAPESEGISMPEESYISQLEQDNRFFVWGPVKRDKNNNSYILLGRKYRNFYSGQNGMYLIVYIRESSIHDISS